MRKTDDKIINVCLVCSAGGHLRQAIQLLPILRNCNRYWVSFKKSDGESLLEKEDVTWAHYPTQRNIINLYRNFIIAIKLFFSEKVDVVISTGAGVGIPFCVLGKLMGKKIIFIESFSRINNPSLTGRIVYHFSDYFFIQWKSLKKYYPKGIYKGKLL